MPLYEYACDQCKCKFELLRSFGRADDPPECPQCHHLGGRRLVSNFAAMSKGSDGAATSVGGGSSCGSCSSSSCAGCRG
jgi:putative FmdB family regulatory protein